MNEKIESIECHACTNRLISSLRLKPCSLLKAKDSLRYRPFSPVPLKQLISFEGDYLHWGNGSLLGFGLVIWFGMADGYFPLWFNKLITISSPFIFCYLCTGRLLLLPFFLFCLNSEHISFVIFITSVCHNLPIAILPIMGIWSKVLENWV